VSSEPSFLYRSFIYPALSALAVEKLAWAMRSTKRMCPAIIDDVPTNNGLNIILIKAAIDRR
jgi:hypothetical protein